MNWFRFVSVRMSTADPDEHVRTIVISDNQKIREEQHGRAIPIIQPLISER